VQIGEAVAVSILAASGSVAATPQYRLHLDARRRGSVDPDWRGLAVWRWGRAGRGAIVLCNNDDDDTASATDNADASINGGNDSQETAMLVFRRTGPAPPGSWAGFLEVSAANARRIRIFDSRAAGGAEILGPTAGARHRFLDLAFTEREYSMEAIRYAGSGFNGLVRLTFSIEDGGSVIFSQAATLRVAPWIMPNHLDPAEKVFVVNAGSDNSRFRAELSPLVGAAGCSLVQHASGDVWMQDCMEIGLAARPDGASPKAMPAVVRAKRNRPLRTFPRTLLAPDFGYEEVAPLSNATTFDSTGNLEVTPPILSGTRRRYPWGRIYYGRPGPSITRPGEDFDAVTRAFLRAQRVQAPFEIDTGWLTVGHVDEVVSFVPAPGGRRFKLLIASPRRAYAILRAARRTNGTARLLTGRGFPDGAGGSHSAEVTITDFLTRGIPALGLTATTLRSFNNRVARHLNRIKQVFRREIRATADEIVEVPILYFPNEDEPVFADALTAGIVNMLVINRHCIAPKPFGPVVAGRDLFEQDLRTRLAGLGLTITFINDWYEYHVLLGEVHCGTNTLRRPTRPPKWWTFV